ncbi:alpha-mannosidase [Evansella vedderi]|uniref:Alpha-mannosidase n=1 Tax=Evansella vedderi TaxID=38282 RepID=A0ABU0A0K2_9BACI|nr:alpha-mannosidase [Evansella vedderi]MDQ0255865.1 alpha-mannosidase [Evansella vedderi]
MFYKIEKLQNRVNELDRYRYRETKTIDFFHVYEPEVGEETILPSSYTDKKMRVNDNWCGRDKYIWLNTTLEIPEAWSGQKVVVYLDLGRTGGGNNSGFESLLYVNKAPFQGVDSNHQEVILPADVAGTTVEIDIMMWSGLEGGGHPQEQFYRLKEAWFGVLDEQVDELYYKSKAIVDTLGRQDTNEPAYASVLASLNYAFKEVDWMFPGSELFYASLERGLALLNKEMEKIEKHEEVTVHTVGHSHIDLAWLWRTKHTKEKAKRTFSTVLRLMELYPDYTYLQSQPQLYEWIKEEEPELFEAIKEKVKDGQWEVEGGMWVESDCNIPSGESFVRQLLYGKNFFKKEFGKTNKVLWLPDVFGYSWSLPQILKKSGIDTFMTTKISWNQYNRMPHDTFYWRGIDGTEILTHFITTPEPGRDENSWFYTYNGLITAETVKGIWKNYRDKEINQDLLLAYGYGDGGGGVNREMLELKRQYHKIPSLPKVTSTKVGDYFKKLHDNVTNTDQYIHTWDGELYLEYHRGTYTSQAKMKEMNRKLEQSLRKTEILSAWNSLENGWAHYPSATLEKAWKTVLLNQFHDIIPGSSITEVYEDAHKDYVEVARANKEIIESQQQDMVQETENSLAYAHLHQYNNPILVTLPNGYENHRFELEGENLESQEISNGDSLLLIEESKPFSFQEIRVNGMKKEQPVTALSEVSLESRTWDTPYYRILWNDNGQVTRIFDKNSNRELIEAGKVGNLLKLYEDKPMAHDAWDIDLYYQEKYSTVETLKECKIIDNGPLRTTLCFTWKQGNLEIKQHIHCYCHTKRIDFETEVDWTLRQHLLKVEFPIAVRTTEAIYDIQFGNVKRPTHWNTSWDIARFETVGHKWAALAEPNYGVSLMNDSKYGYSIKDNVMALSLLKGAIHPDPKADMGIHQFTYSLYPFAGVAHKQDVEREATYLNNKLVAKPGTVQAPFTESLLTISSDQVIVDTVKKAEDNDHLIVRLHEMEGTQVQIKLDSYYKVKQWREVTLMEEEYTSSLHREFNDKPMELNFTPYEIKTLEIVI